MGGCVSDPEALVARVVAYYTARRLVEAVRGEAERAGRSTDDIDVILYRLREAEDIALAGLAGYLKELPEDEALGWLTQDIVYLAEEARNIKRFYEALAKHEAKKTKQATSTARPPISPLLTLTPLSWGLS